MLAKPRKPQIQSSSLRDLSLHGTKARYTLSSCASRSPGADWYENVLGSPRWICAPMVRQSELAFRMLVRQHGVDLCYTPMIPADFFCQAPQERRAEIFQ